MSVLKSVNKKIGRRLASWERQYLREGSFMLAKSTFWVQLSHHVLPISTLNSLENLHRDFYG